MSTKPLSTEMREAVITVCGQAFHYKDTLRPVFINAGVPEPLFDGLRRQDGKSKYTICREILAELDRHGTRGHQVQHAIATQLLAIRAPLPDADQTMGKQALERLRALAQHEKMPSATEESELVARRKRRANREATLKANAEQKAKLADRFSALSRAASGQTRQQRGYSFERFLRDLFASEEIIYRSSYRVANVEQIDGAFKLDSRDYLVEARWRQEPPALNDLCPFIYKVDTKVNGTRGLYITQLAPRPEVIAQLTQLTKSVLIMDGQDIAVILQGLITLRQALEIKADKAAHEGRLFYPLSQAAAA